MKSSTDVLREVLQEEFNITDEWILERFTMLSYPSLEVINIDPIGMVSSFGRTSDEKRFKHKIKMRLNHFKEDRCDKSFEQIISEEILNDRPKIGYRQTHVGNLGSPTIPTK